MCSDRASIVMIKMTAIIIKADCPENVFIDSFAFALVSAGQEIPRIKGDSIIAYFLLFFIFSFGDKDVA